MKKRLFLMMIVLMAFSLLVGCGEKHTHDYKLVEEVPATCTESGVKAYYTCTGCDKLFDENKNETSLDALTIAALGHDYQFVEFVWSENFTAQAKYACSHDASHTQLHDAEVTNAITTERSCETNGVRTYTATYDGHTGTKTDEIPSYGGHDWEAPTYEWNDDFTCTATRVCKNDPEHVESETVVPEAEPVVNPTCLEDGEGNLTATFENENFESQTTYGVIKALGHEWGTVSYEWAENHSSCTATRVCNHDETHIITETAEATSSTFKEATCGEEGIIRYQVHFENELLEDAIYDESIPTTDHNYGDVSYSWNDDHTECTATRVCEFDDTHVESETVKYSISWELEDDYWSVYAAYRVADFKNSAYQDQKEDLFKIEFGDRSSGLMIYAMDNTCGAIEIPSSFNYNEVNEVGWAGFWGKAITSVYIPTTIHYIVEGGFGWCGALTTITYGGTMAEWESIEKGEGWCNNTPLEQIICTDGTITFE